MTRPCPVRFGGRPIFRCEQPEEDRDPGDRRYVRNPQDLAHYVRLDHRLTRREGAWGGAGRIPPHGRLPCRGRRWPRPLAQDARIDIG